MNNEGLTPDDRYEGFIPRAEKGHNDHLHTEPIAFVPQKKMGLELKVEPDYWNKRVPSVETPQASNNSRPGRERSGALIGIGGGPTRATTLPTDGAERKKFPIATGLLDYFPDALAAIANLSFAANEQHNPGQPVHWARGKSTDHADTLQRHFLQRGTLDSDGKRHSVKIAWRALAMLQEEIEAEWKESTGAA